MANILKQIVSNFEGSDKVQRALDIETLPTTIVRGTAGENIMMFPLDVGDKERPVVHFECQPVEAEEIAKSIYFPCPQGIAVSDSGEYTTFNLGFLGGAVAKALKSNPGKASKEGDPFSGFSASQALSNVADMAQMEFDAVGPIGASIIAARRMGADELATEVEFGMKTLMNPRTNTAFSGNSIRSFQFEFKMIGRNPAEVQMIDNIQKTFRKFVYAERFNKTSSFMLSYPPQWTIRFVDPLMNELKYIPKIYTCYLTGVNTVINSSSNTFRREDLSPYEIDISLQFQETKVLTRGEMVKLEEDGDRDNIHDSEFQELLLKTKDLAGDIEARVKGGLDAARDKAKAKEDKEKEK